MSEVTLFNVAAYSPGESKLASCQASCYQPTGERESQLLQGYQQSLSGMGIEDEYLALPLQRTEAMLEALNKTPHLLEHLEKREGKAWLELHQQFTSLQAQPNRQVLTSMSDELETRMRLAVAAAHKGLAEIEIKTTGEAMRQALTALGYEVEQKDRATRASKGGTTIWTEVGPKGEVMVDVSGITGLSCTTKVQELGEELKRRGIALERKQSTWHNDITGGELAKALRAELPEPPPPERKPLGLSILKRRKNRRRLKVRA
jgi:hypothetical protein